ncbi:MAG: GAF domain-containing protein [Fimbriimonadaceae bacterium]|nr:GAF domain-containing protein [Fimbriimonadaceae bacterium]
MTTSDGFDNQDPPAGQDELARLRAELARVQNENDKLKNELASRAPTPPEGAEKGALAENTLLISEVEVRGAIARQLRNGARLLQASRCVYLLFDSRDDLVAQRPALGLDEEQLGLFRCRTDRGVSGEVFRTRKPVRIDDLDDARAAEEPLAAIGCTNGISVPLLIQIRDEENRVIDSKAIGVMWVMNRRGSGKFSDDDVRLLTVFARQVAAVVATAEYFRELTRQKQTLVDTLENLPAGIVFVGLDERIQLINGTARKLFGIAADRGVGEQYYRVMAHQQTCEVLGASLREDEDKIAKAPFEIEEEERVYQIQAARVRGGDDALNGVVAVFDDVTEMQRLDQMKQEFVQTFTAELLGPLASIHGFTQMLQRIEPDEFDGLMRREIHGVIGDECQRLRRHIQDLLNVSRLEQGIKLHLNLSQIDLAGLVRRVVEHEASVARRHQFELELPADLPAIVGDEPRLEEVFFNLVSNAIKYMPDGGPVKVVVGRENGNVRVAVTDRGPGLAKELHEAVFQKFARVQQSDDRVRAGRGIGLFISRFFVEAHGGQIGLDSEVGQGSTFWFRVPLQAATKEG